MKFTRFHKCYLTIILSVTILFSSFLAQLQWPVRVNAAEGEEISGLNRINQNESVKFSALKTADGKMTISNDSKEGGFTSKGITNTSYLITSNRISGDFSVEATLKVVTRTITGTGGVAGVGAFSGTGKDGTLVTSVARGDSGARSYYKKTNGFGAASPNIADASIAGTSISLKLERNGGKYKATINKESKELSDLDAASSGDMYLGFVICGAVAEVDSFIIKQGDNIVYSLSQPAMPKPDITALVSGQDVKLSWTGIDGAESYSVECKETVSSSWTVKVSDIKSVSHTISGLKSMTPYDFRIKVTGGPSNNLYSSPVMAIPGFDWSKVSAPVITGTSVSADGTEITLRFNMVLGALGATKANVEMSRNGTILDTKSVTEVITTLGASNSSVKFVPSESGKYIFTIKASRDGENSVKQSSTYNVDFDLPVAKPIAAAKAAEKGSIKVLWDAVKEAQNYKVEYKKSVDKNWLVAAESTKELFFIIKNIEVDMDYDFKVTAFKGKNSASSIVSAKSKDVQGDMFEWKSIIFGQSTSSKNNSITVDNKNDTVNLTAGSKDGSTTGGKVTGSHDGISYYYTEIDPSKNFELSADIKVNFFAKPVPDNQEGFGIMARDNIGKSLDTTVFASNMAMVGGYRGLIQSVFRNNVKDVSGAGAVMEEVNKFGDRPVNDGTAVYKMTLKKTNTGYHVNVDNGTEKIYYRPKQLEILNPGKVFVGFFAARVASITVSNISMKTTNAATDPPAVPEPPKAAVPSINVVSLTGTANKDYNLSVQTNVKGSMMIKQDGKQIYSGSVDNNKSLIKRTLLVKGDNTFELLFNPDPSEKITSNDPVTLKHIVTFKNYGTPGGSIYVSKDGRPDSTGLENDPTDIYTAIKFIGDGQKIYVHGGTYNLTAPVEIKRGNDGTGKNPKVLSAYNGQKPVFDFGNTSNGVILAGDCWNIYGIDITKSTSTGLTVSGNYNVVERVNTYKNANTGLQISGSSAEKIDKWPSNNLVLGCISYDNKDAAENNADGFGAKLTCGPGNVFRSCISHNNCDDGWDLYSKLETGPIGEVIVENCVAYGNGTLSDGTRTKGDGNGFKMGGEGLAVKHIIRNCLSFGNNAAGITSNSDPAIIVKNNTSVDNGRANFSFDCYANVTPQFVAEKNISFKTASGTADSVPSSILSDNNFFFSGTASSNVNKKQAAAVDFVSVVRPVSVSIDADGKISAGDYMKLSSSSSIRGGANLTDYSNISNPAKKSEDSSKGPATGDNGLAGIIFYAITALLSAIGIIVLKIKHLSGIKNN